MFWFEQINLSTNYHWKQATKVTGHNTVLSFSSSTYAVKPAKALLKGERQIFVVKTMPKEVKTYKQTLKMKLNDDRKYDQVCVFLCLSFILDRT